MPSSVVVTETDRFTVAGLIRHLARSQPEHEMLVQGDERRTWAEEFDGLAGWRRRCAATGSVPATGWRSSTATASPTSTSSSAAR